MYVDNSFKGVSFSTSLLNGGSDPTNKLRLQHPSILEILRLSGQHYFVVNFTHRSGCSMTPATRYWQRDAALNRLNRECADTDYKKQRYDVRDSILQTVSSTDPGIILGSNVQLLKVVLL